MSALAQGNHSTKLCPKTEREREKGPGKERVSERERERDPEKIILTLVCERAFRQQGWSVKSFLFETVAGRGTHTIPVLRPD